MEKLLHDFGFEPTFFIAQIINFLILAFIFKKFLYKPILKVLDDRAKKVARGIKETEDAGKALEEAETKKDEIIKAATLEAEKIIEETKKSSEAAREELMEKTRSDAQKIIADARTNIEEDRKKAEKEVQDVALEISKKVLSRILDELFTKEEKQKILARDIKKITNYE